jgi:hypothetical protein
MARSDVDDALGAAPLDDTTVPPLPRQRDTAPPRPDADARLMESIRRALASDDPVARLIARCRQEMSD